jgi:hypothetical protein
VEEPGRLLLNSGDDFGRRMTRVLAPDASGEIKKLISVDVPQRGAAGTVDIHGKHGTDASG